MKTLGDLGPSKLQPSEQDRIREAADSLFFGEDSAANSPLEDVESMLRMLVESGRWEQVTAERLADDLYSCAFAEPIAAQAA